MDSFSCVSQARLMLAELTHLSIISRQFNRALASLQGFGLDRWDNLDFFHVVSHRLAAYPGLVRMMVRIRDIKGNEQDDIATGLTPDHFHHVLVAKGKSKVQPRFKVGVEPMGNRLHLFKRRAAKSYCKGHGFWEIFWAIHIISLLQGDRQTPSLNIMW